MSEQHSRSWSVVNPTELDHPTLAFVHDYWQRKRGTRAMPSRADIHAPELREHLGWIVMADVLPDFRDFRYRLIGTLVSRYFIHDATGKTVREAFVDSPREIVDMAIAVHRKCARDKVIVLTHGAAGWSRDNFEEFSSLYLPLSDDGENCNVVLNVFVFDRSQVLLSREIAKANGGQLPKLPPKRRTS